MVIHCTPGRWRPPHSRIPESTPPPKSTSTSASPIAIPFTLNPPAHLVPPSPPSPSTFSRLSASVRLSLSPSSSPRRPAARLDSAGPLLTLRHAFQPDVPPSHEHKSVFSNSTFPYLEFLDNRSCLRAAVCESASSPIPVALTLVLLPLIS
jgi:hypothetical protein